MERICEIEMVDISHEERRFVHLMQSQQAEQVQGQNPKSSESWADEVERVFSADELDPGISKPSWSMIVRLASLNSAVNLNETALSQPLNPPLAYCVKIDFDDIRDEMEFRECALVAYVLGCNPPLSVMEGYFRRIWGK